MNAILTVSLFLVVWLATFLSLRAWVQRKSEPRPVLVKPTRFRR